MEKSMIQDLDNIRTSIGFKNTFTTSSRDRGYDLRKSKISNLPSYKKSDLSVKLPFVVIFQTIQIQRLSEQIQALRVALKDSERQAFNCQSYEVQIRQLTDQCHQYDIQLLEYRQEIEKLNIISQKIYEQLEEWKQKYQNFDPAVNEKYVSKQQQCQNLQSQINKWRDRYRALEKSKDTELQDLKLAMQSQRKSVLDRQIKQCNLKFEAERNYLHGQLKKIQEACDQRDDQLTRVKFEVEALRIQNEVNIDASRKLKQSQNKLNKLTQEIVRVNELLRRKQQQIQRKDSNQEYLKQLIRTLQRQKINHQNQAIKVPQLQGAIKQWIVRFSRLQNQHNQTRQHIQKIPVLQRNLQNSVMEIERLGMIIKGKMQQLNQSNIKFQKYRSLYEQSKKSQQKVPGLERKINQMNYEFQRLNDVLKKRLIEVEQAKNRITSLEKVLRNFQQAEPQKKRIEQQYKRQIRQIEKNKKDINELERQLRRIPELEAVINDQRNIRQQYAVEVQRLNRAIKEKCDQNEILQEKMSHLLNKVQQFQNIETELNNYKNQNNRMVQQIDNMNSKIKTKCEQVDKLAELITNLQKNLQEYKIVEQRLIQNIQKTEKIIEELNNTKIQLQDTQKNLLQCESQLNEAKNTILQINNDKQMLNKNLNIKTQELDHTKNELNTCLQQIQRLRQVQRKYNLLQEEMRVTQNKLRQVEDYLRKQRARNEQLEYKNQMLNAEIQKIKINGYFPEQFRHMFSQLKSTQNEKERQMQNLQKKQGALQKFADQIQNIVANVCDTMKVRNNEWAEINKKITDSIGNVQKLQKLQDQLNELRVQNIDLQSKIKVLNLQMLDMQARKASQKQISPNTFSGTTPLASKSGLNSQMSSTSLWSFNTVPSKKAIDPVVENQTSRVSRVLGNSNLTNNLGTSSLGTSNLGTNNLGTSNLRTSNSKSKYEQIRSPQRFFNENTKPIHTNITSSYQFNNTNSTYNLPSPRVTLPNASSGFVSPAKTSTVYSTAKQSTESYYTTKVTKTNSVTEPFTFKTSFRA